MYEVFPHTADLGLRIRGRDLGELFVDAARALFSIIVANLDEVKPVQERTFRLEGDETDLLLLDWLSELLFVYETEHLLLARFDVDVDAKGLQAVGRGEPVAPERHQLEHEVKAITYHELKVVHEDDGWLAEVIVDI